MAALLVSAGVAALSSCATAPRPAPGEQESVETAGGIGPEGAIAPEETAVAPPASSQETELARLEELARRRLARTPATSYRIGPRDLLNVVVFDVPEMTRKVRVAMNGYVQLPLIGKVRAAGLSEADLSRSIGDHLVQKAFVREPQVDVFVEEYRSQQAAVTGAVAKPGLYPLSGDHYTIMDLISEAGGPTKEAGQVIEFLPSSGRSSLDVFDLARGNPSADSSRAIRIDLNDLRREDSSVLLDVPVVPGDIIYVPKAGNFTVEGWVDKPGTYELVEGAGVLSALAMAGGYIFPARMSSVEILRDPGRTGDPKTVIVVDATAVRSGKAPDVPLRAGDVVRVPAVKSLLPAWAAYSLLRNLISIGASVPIF